MIGCDQAAILIERRLDGEASPQDDALLDAHVAGCPSCAALVEAETTLHAELAARFGGAMPSPAFAAAVRVRVAAEPAPTAGWIPDALNAAGLLLSAALLVPLAVWWGGAAGTAIGIGAGLVACYPLLLAALAGEAGSGEPDPAP
jgi:anti-sigma factor RsiW